MSGHSKWANIKHKKERTDAKKGKIFTKIGREIAIAVKQGGPDPNANAKLKDVVAKAKSNNMPNDTISRSIKKAAGDVDATNYEEVVYEGYGPKGVAVIVESLTDNRNRTAADVRHYFDKFGGNLGTTGCVSFMFDKKGQLIIEKQPNMDEDEIFMIALEAGAEDVSTDDDVIEIITDASDFSSVREALENGGFEFISSEITMIPQTTTKLDDPNDVLFMERLIDMLEDLDDVQNIYHNWEEEND